MKMSNWMGLGASVLLALGAGWWLGRSTAPPTEHAAGNAAAAPQGEPEILYYRNPMGLPDTSPVPKKDSMGMDYIPVYAGGEPRSVSGTVVLSPEKVQKLGVRTHIATLDRLSAEVRVSASVQVDETRQFVVAPRFEGWIERLHANQTGMPVRRGQPLMTLYSPNLLAAQEEYRIADEAASRLATSDPASANAMRQLRDAADSRLRNWEVAGGRITMSGAPARLVLTAPSDAVVIDKMVVEGDRFEAGQTVLRLADLSTVWIVAQVPTSMAADLATGNDARFETPSLPGEYRDGVIDFIQPVVDMASRTIGVRIVLPNEDGALRPGLFGDVTLGGTPDAESIVLPRSAVIDSGTRRIVLVQVAPGRFEPRDVRLGRRAGDQVAVLDGVAVGEEVVVSANFLIDAESNLTSALQGLSTAADGVDEPSIPATGRNLDSAPIEDHSGHTMPTESPPASTSTHDGHGTPTESNEPPADDPHAGHRGEH